MRFADDERQKVHGDEAEAEEEEDDGSLSTESEENQSDSDTESNDASDNETADVVSEGQQRFEQIRIEILDVDRESVGSNVRGHALRSEQKGARKCFESKSKRAN